MLSLYQQQGKGILNADTIIHGPPGKGVFLSAQFLLVYQHPGPDCVPAAPETGSEGDDERSGDSFWVPVPSAMRQVEPPEAAGGRQFYS